MSALLKLQDGRTYHVLVVADIVRWHVSYGASYTETTVHFRNGSCVLLSENRSRELESAVEAYAVAKAGES